MKTETINLKETQKKRDEELTEEEMEQLATDLANKVISKGVQHLANERDMEVRKEKERLEKNLGAAEEGNRILQQQALEINDKLN